MENKGEYLGTCNLSSCTTGLPADWYNHGSYSHYCESCACRLNADEYNKRDALRLFGHELCTKVEEEKSKYTDIGDLDISKDQHLMSIMSQGQKMGYVEIENGKIVTSGQIGENTYNNFVELIYGLQGFGIKIDDFFF